MREDIEPYTPIYMELYSNVFYILPISVVIIGGIYALRVRNESGFWKLYNIVFQFWMIVSFVVITNFVFL